MNTGTVKFFNSEKGFGFIKIDNSTDEIFVHASGCKESIKENDRVQFSTEEGKKGLYANNVYLFKY